MSDATSDSGEADTGVLRRLDFRCVEHCGRRHEFETLQEYFRGACLINNRALPRFTFKTFYFQGEKRAILNGKQPCQPCHKNVHQKESANENQHQQNQKLLPELESRAGRPSPTAVIIQAPSGAGKSSLMKKFLDDVGNKALICSGNFEERTAGTEPFAAIIVAFDMLIDHLQTEKEVWTQRIEEALECETEILQEIIPHLNTLIGNASRRKSDATTESAGSAASSINFDGFGNMADKEWRFERFRLSLRALIRCVSVHIPVLLVLDDLHWAEPDSIALIKTLIDDTLPDRKFLFVGATRPCRNYAHLCKFRDESDPAVVQVISLPPWHSDDIALVLSQLLDRHFGAVQQLADEIFQKSGGNCFIVVHFLRLLEQKGHLYFSPISQKWEWNLDMIAQEAIMTNEVTDVIATTLKTVDSRRKLALITAASFGASHFDVETIVHAMKLLEQDYKDAMTYEECAGCQDFKQIDDTEEDNDESTDPVVVRQNIRAMNDTLRAAAQDGLVEEMRPGHFRFAHDGIREAAYKLLPEGAAKHRLHLKIGRQLRSWMDMQAELGGNFSQEKLMLNAANQLNLGACLIEDSWEKLDLAELNYQAAELAAKKTAFFPAVNYLTLGLAQLGNKAWEDQHDLALKLSVALTRIKYACGLHQECLEIADEVITRGTNFSEKRAVFHTKLLCLMQIGRLDDAKNLVIQILSDLGHPFPKRMLAVHGMMAFNKISMMLKRSTDCELLGLSSAPNDIFTDILAFMERLVEVSLFGGNPMYMFLVCLREVEIALNYGSPQLSYSFASWAYVKVRMGDYDEGWRFAKLALHFTKVRRRYHLADARSTIASYFFVHHWRMPPREAVEPLVMTIKDMRDHGALESVLTDGQVVIRHIFSCSEPLSRVADESKKYLEMLLDYKKTVTWNINAPLYELIQVLMGESGNSDPSVLRVELIEQSHLKGGCLMNHNRAATFHFHFFALVLATFFGNFQHAKKLISPLNSLDLAMPGILVTQRYFYSGIVYLNLAKSPSGLLKGYRRKGLAVLKKIRMWAEEGCVNCIHMYLLLHAELLSGSSANRDMVRIAFDESIDSAAKIGMQHHEAFANERCAIYLELKGERDYICASYLARALYLYEEWGAVAKVKHIQHCHGHILKSK